MRFMILSLLLLAAHVFAAPSGVELEVPSGAMSADVYLPEKPGRNAVVLLHGFMSSKDHHSSTAAALAREGFTVVVPNLDYSFWESNHAERAKDVRSLLLQLRKGTFAPPPEKTALVGHSAGGLTALLVAAEVNVAAVVLLDSVISAGRPGSRQPGIADSELSRISSPVLSIEAPPDSCNNYRDAGLDILPRLASPVKERITLSGASHCDFMDPHRACRLICGRGSEESRILMRHSMIRFLKQHAK